MKKFVLGERVVPSIKRTSPRGLSWFRAVTIFLLALALLGSFHNAQAANRTWNGGSTGPGDDNWSTAPNWGGVLGVGGTAPSANDSLTFSGTTRLTPNNNIAPNTLFVGITFDATAISPFTLAGNAINLGGDIVNNSTALQTINLGLNLTGSSRTINAALGDITIGGVISGGFGIVKIGTGTLTLNVANSYTGVTTLGSGIAATSGTITLGVNDALGSGGFTFAGGILAANSRTDSTIGALSLTANSTLDLSGDIVTSGSLTFASMTATTGTTLTINGWTGSANTTGTDDHIFITSQPTSIVLGQINFTGYDPGAAWLVTGEIVPVPEPINVALGVFGIVFAGFGMARRLRKKLKC